MGKLYAGDLELETLELPWKNNGVGISCIPPGRYQTKMLWSVRFGRMMPRLLNVPDRSGILIHSGNNAENTEGCILVGTLRGQFVNNKATMVFGSRNALGQFISWLEGVLEEDAPVYCEVSYGS